MLFVLKNLPAEFQSETAHPRRTAIHPRLSIRSRSFLKKPDPDGFVTGHHLSRADKANQINWALAPAGCLARRLHSIAAFSTSSWESDDPTQPVPPHSPELGRNPMLQPDCLQPCATGRKVFHKTYLTCFQSIVCRKSNPPSKARSAVGLFFDLTRSFFPHLGWKENETASVYFRG
jgi:hypothetical protein